MDPNPKSLVNSFFGNFICVCVPIIYVYKIVIFDNKLDKINMN